MAVHILLALSFIADLIDVFSDSVLVFCLFCFCLFAVFLLFYCGLQQAFFGQLPLQRTVFMKQHRFLKRREVESEDKDGLLG